MFRVQKHNLEEKSISRISQAKKVTPHKTLTYFRVNQVVLAGFQARNAGSEESEPDQGQAGLLQTPKQAENGKTTQRHLRKGKGRHRLVQTQLRGT